MRKQNWGRVLLTAGAVGLAPVRGGAQAIFEFSSLAGGDGSIGTHFGGIDDLDLFGFEVSGAGDVNGDTFEDLVVGARWADPDGKNTAGEAYLLFGRPERDWGGFFPMASLLPPGGGAGQSQSAFGQTGRSACSQDEARKARAMGAYASYVTEHETAAQRSIVNNENVLGGGGSRGVIFKGIFAGDYTGVSVSGAGDVNGDGYSDILIGAFGASPDGKDGAGEAYLVFGHGGDWPAEFELSTLRPFSGGNGSAGVIIKGAEDGDRAGICVGGAGDVNGDGLDDILVGAQWADPSGKTDAGEAYVIYGKRLGWFATLDLWRLRPELGGTGATGSVLRGAMAGDSFGFVATGAGDVNGDGLPDMAFGAYNADPRGVSKAGESYILFGRRGGWGAAHEMSRLKSEAQDGGTFGFVLEGIRENDFSGSSLGAAGDVNGDGCHDIVLGAPTDADPHVPGKTGDCFLVYGGPGPWPARIELASLRAENGGDGSVGTMFLGIDGSDRLGTSAKGLGDLNGDGYGEFGLGAVWADPHGINYAGKLFVLWGRPGGWGAEYPLRNLQPEDGGDGSEGRIFYGIESFDRTGWSCSSTGDFDGDGFSDLVNGAFYGNDVYVVFGGDSGTSGTWRAHAAEGDAPVLAVGVVGDGQESVPQSRCWLDYRDGATPSLVKVTLERSAARATRVPNPAGTLWRIEDNDRANWTTANVTFKYLERDITGLDETSLVLFEADTPAGPWRVPRPQSLDPARNTITAEITAWGCFAIGEAATAGTTGWLLLE